MSATSGDTTRVQLLLHRLRDGDAAAREELIVASCARMTRLARRMLQGYPAVRRWEQTDDVVQGAALRLLRALGELAPGSPRSYFNLAAVQIRRELIDLARRHGGPEGLHANHETGRTLGDAPRAVSDEPVELASWTEFHEAVAALPAEDSELFHLLWYQGLTQGEAAELLGTTPRVVGRRWREARLALHRALRGQVPGT
jgi:RNA polymerase sigma factor (sigma-70 family)